MGGLPTSRGAASVCVSGCCSGGGRAAAGDDAHVYKRMRGAAPGGWEFKRSQPPRGAQLPRRRCVSLRPRCVELAAAWHPHHGRWLAAWLVAPACHAMPCQQWWLASWWLLGCLAAAAAAWRLWLWLAGLHINQSHLINPHETAQPHSSSNMRSRPTKYLRATAVLVRPVACIRSLGHPYPGHSDFAGPGMWGPYSCTAS